MQIRKLSRVIVKTMNIFSRFLSTFWCHFKFDTVNEIIKNLTSNHIFNMSGDIPLNCSIERSPASASYDKFLRSSKSTIFISKACQVS